MTPKTNFSKLLFLKILISGIFITVFPITVLPAQAYIAPSVYITELNLPSVDFKVGDIITGNFTVWNSEEYIVPNISQEFVIFIPDKEGIPETIIGRTLAPEKFLLSPNQKKTIDFSYKLPQNLLTATYQFRISLWSGTGVLMNWEDQEIKISGNDKFLEISNPKVVKDGTEFLPLLGISFGLEEIPKIRFDILNKSPSEISVIPKITIFERQINLDKVKEIEKESLILNAGQAKTIDYQMPSLEKPESYLANLEFFDSSGISISNSLLFRWVIEGKGAEVFDIQSDQDSYSKGDTAKITVYYVGPADGSEIGDGELLVEIYNEKAELTGRKEKTVNLDEEDLCLIEIPIEKEVKNANLKATLSQAGEMLDEYKTGFLKEKEEVKPEKEEVKPEEEVKKINLLYILGGIILLIIIGFIVKKFLKKA